MRTVFLFMMVTLDGYFEGVDHDLSWHQTDDAFLAFAIEQLRTIDTILFGKTTYQMMASYWPTPETHQSDPETAALMDATQKIVFSTTLSEATWEHTTLERDAVSVVAKLKQQRGKDIAIFGSSTLCLSLIEQGLIDEYRLMINPVCIGKGTTLFHGLQKPLSLELKSSRVFANGNVLHTYQPRQKMG